MPILDFTVVNQWILPAAVSAFHGSLPASNLKRS